MKHDESGRDDGGDEDTVQRKMLTFIKKDTEKKLKLHKFIFYSISSPYAQICGWRSSSPKKEKKEHRGKQNGCPFISFRSTASAATVEVNYKNKKRKKNQKTLHSLAVEIWGDVSWLGHSLFLEESV